MPENKQRDTWEMKRGIEVWEGRQRLREVPKTPEAAGQEGDRPYLQLEGSNTTARTDTRLNNLIFCILSPKGAIATRSIPRARSRKSNRLYPTPPYTAFITLALQDCSE